LPKINNCIHHWMLSNDKFINTIIPLTKFDKDSKS
jgi:hypothetical protein